MYLRNYHLGCNSRQISHLKNLRIISFIVFYASFNMGMLINYHFCYKSFDHLTLYVQPENCCDGNCCSNSTYTLKIGDDYDSLELFSLRLIQTSSVIQQDAGFGLEQFIPIDRVTLSIDTGPLIDLRKRPIYLSDRVFLI